MFLIFYDVQSRITRIYQTGTNESYLKLHFRNMIKLKIGTSFTHPEQSDEFATIHETCFEKLHERQNLATEKIQEMEISNKKLSSDAKNLQKWKK